MSKWKDLIAGCFGIEDNLFARHPTDIENAKRLMAAASSDGVSEENVEQELSNYLKSKGCSKEHIEEEMEHFSTGWYWIT